MHAHERRHRGIDAAAHEREVEVAMHVIFVAVQGELAEIGRHATLREVLDRAFGRESIPDQVGDGADPEAVLMGEALEIGAARHAAILVEDLDNDRGRPQPARRARSQPASVCPARVSIATRLRHQRKDMAWLGQILGTRIRRDGQCARCVRDRAPRCRWSRLRPPRSTP